MKRFFILASAAIVALASCAKTEVVYKDAPQEIAFKQITGAMTKAAPLSDAISMGVYAQYNNTNSSTSNEPYLVNVPFAKGTTYWQAENAYWPFEGNLDFTIYAPHSATAAAYDKEEPNKLVISVTDNSSAQTDWLYGANRYIGKAKQDAALDVVLNHALSNIRVNVKCGTGDSDVFKITELKLYDTRQSGTLTVTYGNSTPYTATCAPSNHGTDYDHTYLKYDNNDIPVAGAAVGETAKSFEDLFVFPCPESVAPDRYFLLTYKMKGAETVFSVKLEIDDEWQTGKQYTYAITMNANQILMNPSVNDWGTGAVASVGDTDLSIAQVTE